jgi:hypothetical protein
VIHERFGNIFNKVFHNCFLSHLHCQAKARQAQVL